MIDQRFFSIPKRPKILCGQLPYRCVIVQVTVLRPKRYISVAKYGYQLANAFHVGSPERGEWPM
jgi:hypothetical protein